MDWGAIPTTFIIVSGGASSTIATILILLLVRGPTATVLFDADPRAHLAVLYVLRRSAALAALSEVAGPGPFGRGVDNRKR